MAAFPGSAMPSASAMLAIVDAVPITMHDPAERQIASSMAVYSSASIVPARSSAVYFPQSVQAPSSLPS